MAFGFNRNLGVVLTADTKSLERGLDRANRKVSAFGKSVQSSKGGLGTALISGKGGAAFLGGGAAFVGFQRIVSAAKESEVVLGQTQVAVDALGLSYANNADLIISKSDEISRSSAFDDEEVLKSFQLLVRGTKDVNRALELSALAADVARGRYISLEQASLLVVKANLGQIGALRRVGIQIDKNATSTEALALLQRNYGGAAVKYANSAAGAQDKLNVAVENVAESVGSALTPAIVEMSDSLVGGIDGATKLARALKELANTPAIKVPVEVVFGKGGDGPVGNFAKEALLFAAPQTRTFKILEYLGKLFGGSGAPSFVDSGRAGPRSAGQAASVVAQSNNPNWRPLLTAEQNLRLAQQRAQGTLILKDDLKAAQDLAAFYKSRVGDARTAKDRFAATQALITAENDATDIQRQMADRAVSDARTQKDRLRAIAEKARKDRKDLAERIAKATEDLVGARIERLDLVQSGRDAARRIRDARENLQKQLRIGGTVGIRTAREELQDAQLERRRLKLQGVTFAGDAGTTNNIKIEISSNQDPVKIADEVLARLRKKANVTSTQTRGRRPAVFYGGA